MMIVTLANAKGQTKKSGGPRDTDGHIDGAKSGDAYAGTTPQPEIHATKSKFMLMATNPSQLDNGTPVNRIMFYGTVDNGYDPKNIGEQVWHCDVTLRSTSREVLVGGCTPGYDAGPAPVVTFPARLYIRYATKNGDEPTLLVAGTAIGDPRTYPITDNGENGKYGIDELAHGAVDIVPIKRWDGTRAFHGQRIDQVMTS